jgi:hypothetical protein
VGHCDGQHGLLPQHAINKPLSSLSYVLLLRVLQGVCACNQSHASRKSNTLSSLSYVLLQLCVLQGVRAWAIAMASMVFYLSMEKVWNFRLLATPWYAAQPLLMKLVTMQVRSYSVVECRCCFRVGELHVGRALRPLRAVQTWNLCGWCSW